MLRTASSLPLAGLLTLGSDPARFQTEPPACYRASWQLPGPDSHRQATTSLCQITITSSTSDSGRTPVFCVGGWCKCNSYSGRSEGVTVSLQCQVGGRRGGF